MRTLRRRLAHAREDGGMSTLEFAVLTPLVFTFICTALVLSMWWMAQDRAHTAARKAVETGRGYQASPADGVRQAREWLARSDELIRDPQVSAAGSTPDRVQVTVTGTVVTPIFGWELHISERAQGPVEQWQVGP